MQPVSPTAASYDRTTRFYHWAVAILVVLQWLGAQTIDWFPSGWPRVDARSVHITGGVILAILLALRIIWRLTGGRRLPLADRGVLAALSKATHWGLYALVASMVTIGVFLAWARGDNLYNLVTLPKLMPSNPALRHQLQDLHATLGYAILALAGLHATAALVHRYVWHDGVLARMLPGRRQA